MLLTWNEKMSVNCLTEFENLDHGDYQGTELSYFMSQSKINSLYKCLFTFTSLKAYYYEVWTKEGQLYIKYSEVSKLPGRALFYNVSNPHLLTVVLIMIDFSIAELDPSQLTFSSKQPPKKKRKSRTAFTNHQIFELEKRFLYQKYLSPADRDEIAAQLGLSNAQVRFLKKLLSLQLTGSKKQFQNRNVTNDFTYFLGWPRIIT